MTCTETLSLSAPTYPEHLVHASHALLEATAPHLRQTPMAVALARAVFERYAEHRAQFEPAARAIGADPIDLVLCTLSYDLLMGL